MKQVISFIRPQKYFETKEALLNAGFYAMSAKDVYGRGKRKVTYSYQDSDSEASLEYADSLVLKKRIDIYIADDKVDDLIDVIVSVNATNQAGDGKIFILPLEASYRIHTGDKDEDALR